MFIFLEEQRGHPDVEAHWFCQYCFWIQRGGYVPAQAPVVVPGMQDMQGSEINKDRLSRKAVPLVE